MCSNNTDVTDANATPAGARVNIIRRSISRRAFRYWAAAAIVIVIVVVVVVVGVVVATAIAATHEQKKSVQGAVTVNRTVLTIIVV
jgi:uncharacterized membrane protein YhaH (DUF805 family)